MIAATVPPRARRKELQGGLMLRALENPEDVGRYLRCVAAIYDPRSVKTCEVLVRSHPDMSYGDFLVVEDLNTGEFVSTTCLIPWRCSFEGIALAVAMPEMVGTRPEYRRRGLIKEQFRLLDEMAMERGFDLCIIEGIPYYYRQFGYAYALDHRPADSLPGWKVPQSFVNAAAGYELVPAREAEIPLLCRMYDASVTVCHFHVQRDARYWQFLLNSLCYPVYILREASGSRPAGYAVLQPLGVNSHAVRVQEGWVEGHRAGLALLGLLKLQGASEIQVGGPEACLLRQLVRALGATPASQYQWLVKIPQIGQFLAKLAPVFSRRLACSQFSNLTRTLVLSLYREAFALRFVGGKLETVEPLGFVENHMYAEGGDIRLPPEAFVRLVLGYRTVEELQDAWPDTFVRPELRPIVGSLFPRVLTDLNLPYMYCGQLEANDSAHRGRGENADPTA
jgi:hypothetical protein